MDGGVDYKNYNEEQLYRVLQRIDAEKYPLNYANAKAALEGLSTATATAATPAPETQAPLPSFPQIAVKFAPESGPQTWLGPSRNDFRLVGSGSVSRNAGMLVVKGRRYGFILGLPLRRRVVLDAADIVNVEREPAVVRLEVRSPGAAVRALTFWLAHPVMAQELVDGLPPDKTPDFVPQLAAHMDFEQRLRDRSRSLPVTYGFAALCVAMFIVTVSQGAGWFTSNGIVEIGWGSNFAPATVSGQWWRLLTYPLLHFGLPHLAFNLWALVSFGATAERLYGSFRYALIGLGAALVGGITSIAVQPQVNSAGASGVVFGIFGAMLAAHLHGEIPKSVGRSLRNSTWIFTAVALVGGLLVKGIDNAVHLGGLAAGLAIGSAFQSAHKSVRFAAPAALAVLVLITGGTLARRAAAATAAETEYWDTFRWFASAEVQALKTWSELQALAAASKIDDDSLAARIDQELVPFWSEASSRLQLIKLEANTKIAQGHDYLQSLTNLRLHALQMCASGLRQHDVSIEKACMAEMKRGDELIQARLLVLNQGE